VLQGRTAAAALMRAACATTASLLLHLSDAHPRYRAQSYAIQNDSLMDALICESHVDTCFGPTCTGLGTTVVSRCSCAGFGSSDWQLCGLKS
jgi:hypothetical protein